MNGVVDALAEHDDELDGEPQAQCEDYGHKTHSDIPYVGGVKADWLKPVVVIVMNMVIDRESENACLSGEHHDAQESCDLQAHIVLDEQGVVRMTLKEDQSEHTQVEQDVRDG